MLLFIRTYAKSWVAFIIIGLLVFTFALWGVQYYLHGHSSDTAIVKVNGVLIKRSDWHQSYQRLRQRWFIQHNDRLHFNNKIQKKLEKKALNDLIYQAILDKNIRAQGLRLSPQILASAVFQMPAFQQKGSFSATRFHRVLSLLGYSETQFLKLFESMLLAQQFEQAIQNTSFGLTKEAQHIAQLTAERLDIDFMPIRVAQFEKAVQLQPSDIQAYYQAHQADFQSPEQVQLRYIHLKPSLLKDRIKVTEDALKQYYEQNKQLFMQSDTHTLIPFKSVHAKVKKMLLQQKLTRYFATQADRLAELVYTHPDSLRKASQSLGLSIQQTGFLARQTTVGPVSSQPTFAKNPKVLAVAFSPALLISRHNSTPITLQDGSVVVIRVNQHIKPFLKPLSEVRPWVVQRLRQKQAVAKAASLADQLMALLKTHKKTQVHEQMRRYGLLWQAYLGEGKAQNAVDQQAQKTPLKQLVVNAAFDKIRETAAYDRQLPVYVKLQFPDKGMLGILAIRRVTIDSRAFKSYMKKLSAFSKAVAEALGEFEYTAYVHSLREKAKIIHYKTGKL